MKIVECVPNFSEGRRMDVINAIAEAARSIPGVTILDCQNDPNHNRMVLTFVGAPEAVKEAALASSATAIREIDLTKHTGEHPRMGAVDVVPFVPLKETTIRECVTLAEEFASEFSTRFQVPVFLYEAAAKRPERQDLAKVREGQFEGLRKLVGKDPSKDPDYGPKTVHRTAGATAVGARPILIAYNVNLGTADVSVAKKIAHRIRARDGGLLTLKALGFELKAKNLVQVSMNVTNFNVTSISAAFEAVSKQARELGVPVVESEIVGLVPMAALTDAATSYLKLANFRADQIIENRLVDLMAEESPKPLTIEERNESKPGRIDLGKLSISDFTDIVASREPTPGGGTVSAYAGALAAALVSMVCRLTLGKKGYESQNKRILEILDAAEKSRSKLMELANKDSEAFSNVAAALGLPKTTEEQKVERTRRLDIALKEATEVPAETMQIAYKIFQLSQAIFQIGNKNARSDAETAIELARSAVKGAWSNVRLNLESLKSQPDYVENMRRKLETIYSVV